MCRNAVPCCSLRLRWRGSRRSYSERSSRPLGVLRLSNRQAAPFYHPDIKHRLVPETQELLEKYSHVPREQQSEHVHAIRDRAWEIRVYPCIGLSIKLTPQLHRLADYDAILKRVKDGAVLMDVGTFVDHDLRRLVYGGAPSDKLYGVDIVNHFDVGYDLFRDRERFKGHFIEADILSTTPPELMGLKGQLKAAQALVAFTKPGSWIVGNQIGNPQARAVSVMSVPSASWRHNPDSFAKMFEAVGDARGTRWETQAWLRTFEDMRGLGRGGRCLDGI
ncbi:hypothetical protein Hte_003962 [Hypoxylon texense]